MLIHKMSSQSPDGGSTTAMHRCSRHQWRPMDGERLFDVDRVPGRSQMSTFALTEEQSRFVARVRDIARDDLAALAEAGEQGRVNRRLVEALGGRGLLAELFGDAGGVGDAGATVGDAGAAAGGAGAAAGGAGGAGRPGPSAMRLCLLREALA